MNAGIARTMVAPSAQPAMTPRKGETRDSGPFQDLIAAGHGSTHEETGSYATVGVVRDREKSEVAQDIPDSGTNGEVPTDAAPAAEQQDYSPRTGAPGDSLPLLISLREIERAAAAAMDGAPAGDSAGEPVPEGSIEATDAPRPGQADIRISGARAEPGPDRAGLIVDGGTADDGIPAVPEKPARKLSASLPDHPNEETSPENLPENLPGRVTVTSVQNFAAPASVNVNPTIAALVEVLANEEGAGQTRSVQSPAAFSAPNPSGPAQSLRIELHPAELGMISARLHLSGNQLMVEITPDTQEGWHRLSSDSETIARAMRGLGFDIGKVTILQPSATAAPAGRPAEMNMPDRQTPDFQSGQSGQDSSRGERHAFANHESGEEKTRAPAAAVRGGAGGDLYI